MDTVVAEVPAMMPGAVAIGGEERVVTTATTVIGTAAAAATPDGDGTPLDRQEAIAVRPVDVIHAAVAAVTIDMTKV